MQENTKIDVEELVEEERNESSPVVVVVRC